MLWLNEKADITAGDLVAMTITGLRKNRAQSTAATYGFRRAR